MFKYKAKSDEELLDLLADGKANFEVLDILAYKKDNYVVLKLTIKCWDINGKEKTVIDYISEKTEWKLKNFCYSCSLQENYDNETFEPQQAVGQGGEAIIGTEKSDGYNPKNIIVKYIRSDEKIKLKPKDKHVPASEAFDDDIPF
jgi:hypothetical protein